MTVHQGDAAARQMRQLFIASGDHESAAELALLTARSHLQQGQVPQARQLLEECARDARAMSSPRLAARVQLEQATLIAHVDRDFAAAESLLGALVASGNLGELDATALLERGYCLTHQAKGAEAERVLKQGLTRARQLNHRAAIAQGLQYLATVGARQGDTVALAQACHNLLEAARVAETMPPLLAQIADSLGRAYSRRGQYRMASRWFHQSIRKKRALGDVLGIATSYGGLGEAHLRAGHYAQAIKAFDEDLRIVRSLPEANGALVAQLLCLRAECGRRQGRLAVARRDLVEARQVLPKVVRSQRQLTEGYVDTYQARTLWEEDRPREALELLRAAERKFTAAEYQGFLPSVFHGIGHVQLQLGDLDAARSALEWALEHESDPYEQRFIYQDLVVLAQREGDSERLVLYTARVRFLGEHLTAEPVDLPSLPPPSRRALGSGHLAGARLAVEGEVPSMASTGMVIPVAVRLADRAGAPLAGLELTVDSESLKQQGGTLSPGPCLQTDAKGRATVDVRLGPREGTVQLEVRGQSLPVKTEIALQVCRVVVEMPVRSPLPPAVVALVRELFHRVSRLVRVTAVTPRAPGRWVLGAECALGGSTSRRKRASLMIKVGPADEMIAERDRHHDCMEWVRGAGLPVLVANAVQGDLAALAYAQPGAEAVGEPQPLDRRLAELTHGQLNTAVDRLFGERLRALYRERRYTRDALAASYALPEGFRGGTFWPRIAEYFPPGTVRQDAQGRVVIRFADRVRVPGLFAAHRRFLGGGGSAQRAHVHGGVCAENLCVDKAGNPWLTAWSNFAEGHLFYDFITLEVDTVLQAARDPSVNLGFADWYRIAADMLEAYRIGLTGYWAPVTFLTRSLPTIGLKKAYAVVTRVRRVATTHLQEGDRTEYLRGLFCHAVARLAVAEGQQQVFALLALAVAARVTMQREAITFAHLHRLKPEAVLEVVERVGEELLLRALADASRAQFDKLFPHVSARRRDLLFSEIEYLQKDVSGTQRAQEEIVNVLKILDARRYDLFEDTEAEAADADEADAVGRLG